MPSKEKVAMKCPRCGIETSEDVYRCPNCGNTLRIREQAIIQKLMPLWVLVGINVAAIFGIVQIYRSVANTPASPYPSAIENMPWGAVLILVASIIAGSSPSIDE